MLINSAFGWVVCGKVSNNPSTPIVAHLAIIQPKDPREICTPIQNDVIVQRILPPSSMLDHLDQLSIDRLPAEPRQPTNYPVHCKQQSSTMQKLNEQQSMEYSQTYIGFEWPFSNSAIQTINRDTRRHHCNHKSHQHPDYFISGQCKRLRPEKTKHCRTEIHHSRHLSLHSITGARVPSQRHLHCSAGNRDHEDQPMHRRSTNSPSLLSSADINDRHPVSIQTIINGPIQNIRSLGRLSGIHHAILHSTSESTTASSSTYK